MPLNHFPGITSEALVKCRPAGCRYGAFVINAEESDLGRRELVGRDINLDLAIGDREVDGTLVDIQGVGR